MLLDLERSVSWDVLLLQEFTASRFVQRFESIAGHRVFLTAPSVGCRACCIVIHVSLVHRIIDNTVVFRDRGVAVALHWEGWNLLLVSFHLHPGHSRVAYSDSLEELREMVTGKLRDKFSNSNVASRELLNTPIRTVVGVDAQAIVGKPLTNYQSLFIGDAILGELSWKGADFINFCMEHKLRLCNTFSSNVADVWTCHHDFRVEPNQIDYVLSDVPLRAQKDSGVKQVDASNSDHRCTFLYVLGRWLQPR